MSDVGASAYGVVIVEDEERARRTLRTVIAADPELVLLAETAGREAPAVIERCRPLILLLDVQMPQLDGFGVLRALGDAAPPIVIFVTAWDEYALAAFEVAAVDYVLKPFSDERLLTALKRAKARLAGAGFRESHAAVQRLLDHIGAPVPATPPRLMLRDGGRTLLLDPAAIDWIEAQGVYARLHMKQRNVVVRASLAELARRLDEHGFVRIHRSLIVNVARIQEIAHRSHGDCSVRLADGTELAVSRTRKSALDERLTALERVR